MTCPHCGYDTLEWDIVDKVYRCANCPYVGQ